MEVILYTFYKDKRFYSKYQTCVACMTQYAISRYALDAYIFKRNSVEGLKFALSLPLKRMLQLKRYLFDQ